MDKAVKKSNRYNSFEELRSIAALGIAIMHYLANIDKNIADVLKTHTIFIQT
ncbi:hypothetical protein [Segatella bryantii]|uniref:hypothetical protein n=1 Tax=Segatella bryantii TaxID=77095 RepID=UPI0024305BFF|nr:hypothetical protein [Segatella bryantii]